MSRPPEDTQEEHQPGIVMALALPPPFHGSNIANAAIWNSCIQRRMRCHLVDMSDPRGFENIGRLDLENIRIAISALLRLCITLSSKRVDIVYLTVGQNTLAYLRDGLIIVCAKLFSNARIVAHLHGSYFRTFYLTRNAIVRKFVDATMSRVDVGIVLSDSLKQNLEHWTRQVAVVPNGTNVCRWTDVTEKLSRRQRSSTVTITALSNLMRSKGTLDLLKAFALVREQCPNTVLKLAGAWAVDPVTGESPEAQRDEAQRIIHDHELETIVQFLGVVTGREKEELLEDTDIFVLPSQLMEGQPISVIEAMAAGCAVVATARGAIPETVVDGMTGLIVEPKAPAHLAARLVELVQNRELRTQLAQRGRERYEASYTEDQFVERMLSTLQELLTSQRQAT